VVFNGADSGLIRFSRDNGAKWSPGKVIESAEPFMWLYSDMLEVYPGVFLVASATENSSTAARISLRYVTLGAAITPFGDTAAERRLAAAADHRNLAIADDFDRPDNTSLGFAPTGQEWTKVSSVLSISTGAIYMPNDGSSGMRYAVIDPRCAHVDIEADFIWQNNSGHGIVFRYTDANNHWFFTMETTGTNARLYERVGGTATQKGTIATTTPENVWHRLRVVDLGTLIRCYVEGALVLGVAASAPSAKSVGVQLSNGASAIQRCRRFVVHRRGAVV
jgi:hypothetical protein